MRRKRSRKSFKKQSSKRFSRKRKTSRRSSKKSIKRRRRALLPTTNARDSALFTLVRSHDLNFGIMYDTLTSRWLARSGVQRPNPGIGDIREYNEIFNNVNFYAAKGSCTDNANVPTAISQIFYTVAGNPSEQDGHQDWDEIRTLYEQYKVTKIKVEIDGFPEFTNPGTKASTDSAVSAMPPMLEVNFYPPLNWVNSGLSQDFFERDEDPVEGRALKFRMDKSRKIKFIFTPQIIKKKWESNFTSEYYWSKMGWLDTWSQCSLYGPKIDIYNLPQDFQDHWGLLRTKYKITYYVSVKKRRAPGFGTQPTQGGQALQFVDNYQPTAAEINIKKEEFMRLQEKDKQDKAIEYARSQLQLVAETARTT